MAYCPQSTANVYPLERDAAEHDRLDAQARFWSPDAQALFELAGIAPGWHVADLGSGTLHVAERLAERVGPRGSVVAIDSDAMLVRRNAALARAIAAAPVRIVEGDAYATGLPRASLDAAHARFLAAPAGRLDALVAEMTRIVRPGGCVLLQEPDAATWNIPAAGRDWLRLREFIRLGFELRGGDFDAGRQLRCALHRAGAAEVQERRVARTLPAAHPYSALPLAFARQLRPLWLSEGVLRESELDTLLAKITAALAEEGATQTFTLVQAWARQA